MCDSYMMKDGPFEPVVIKDEHLSFIYMDKKGKNHILIKDFAMDFTVTEAVVKEVKVDGIVTGYVFLLT